MLHELDAGANLSLLPDCRKKLIPYNPKAKMHKPLSLPGSFPTASSRIARMRALDPPPTLDFPNRSPPMSEEQTKDRDGMADAIATVAIIAIAVLAAVLWVSSRG